ncbi:MAG: hypothetical protein SFU56_18515 [Capsulimonadales bacterium]|nr:hypothetical protein [Capsulimonadales bacterium]
MVASLLLLGLFAPSVPATPPPVTSPMTERSVAKPEPSPHNTRNRKGKAVARPAGTAGTAKTVGRARSARGTVSAPPSVDYLLFCNQPERLTRPGAYADARLIGGRTYRIFFHYRNMKRSSAPLTLAFHGTAGAPLTVSLRKGIADPQNDPPRAGRQALTKYLRARSVPVTGRNGSIALPLTLRSFDTASGILTVRPSADCRFRVLFDGGRQTVRGARVTEVPAPRREVTIRLSETRPARFFRIGRPDDLPEQHAPRSGNVSARDRMDGSYGLLYSFHVRTPPGRRVRITFSPRGGQSGMVALVDGSVRSSNIVPPAGLALFAETTVTDAGLHLVTMPFGGVFYPVEIAFHLR